MKSSQIEDQHVWQEEMEQRLQQQEAAQAAANEMEKRQLKETHWMHCPKCG